MAEAASVWLDFKAGDRGAYEQVIRDHYQELYAYGIRLQNNPDFIKDCLHDLFVYIWERRASLAETDDISLYLLKSLRNRVVKQVVKEGRLVGLEEEIGSRLSAEASAEDEIVYYEDLLQTKERVKYALGELSSRQREVLHLRFYQGLSNERIADLLNISKPAVANLVHAGLKNLRQIWRSLQIVISLFF